MSPTHPDHLHARQMTLSVCRGYRQYDNNNGTIATLCMTQTYMASEYLQCTCTELYV